MKNYLIIFIIVLVVIAAGSFFAGTKYQASNNRSGNFNFSGGNGQFRRGMGGPGSNGNIARGQIIDVSDNNLTVKLPDGSSKIIILSDDSTISKSATGSRSDLKSGETVAVFGTSNSDGSLTAQNVQLNPEMRGGQPTTQPSSQP
ncbi:MAG: DUF5666 domain-containing protein [Candidatus Gottesmanbacteria bacterium]